jgi:uncharacterized surface protein with fasciclin (FAS1) repeats
MESANPNETASKGWAWRRDGRLIDRDVAVRFFKYAVLISLILLDLKVVFDGYSFYIARRAIDAELDTKGTVTSLEFLQVLQRRQFALTIESLETRCAERDEIAFFRVFSVEKENKLRDYYNQTMTIKSSLIDEIKRLGSGLVDAKLAVDYINQATFTASDFEMTYWKILPNVNKDDQKYKDLMDQVHNDLNKYAALVLNSTDLQSLVKEAQEESKNQWHLQAVRALEERLSRLTKKRDEIAGPLRDLDDIMARYGAWTDALTGGFTNSEFLDDMNVEMGNEDLATLNNVQCNRFKQFYEQVHNKLLTSNPPHRSIVLWYNQQLSTFFSQPPAAQTLFVSLFLGALGALTVNVLRLSQLGWWRGQNDPLWGEIAVSPFLGALAAFSIYLVGSAGLLLTSDLQAAKNGASPLSASFIGLLAFLSGFLYDAAFGKVRQVGTQLFTGDKSADLAQNSLPDDRSLAEALNAANAALAAGLLLKYGIGTKLASESQFTLLIPSDQAMQHLTLKSWTELNDKQGDAFDRWYRHHHAAARITKKDVTGAEPQKLAVDDGTKFDIAVAGDDFKIGNTKAMVADIIWNKGVIHVLQDELS